jgi:acetolactate synthase-1/2/3 large subunit
MAEMNGAQMVMKSLEAEHVKTLFGLPGGQVITLYDALYDSKIEHILMRHEQAAAHAADGYARVSGNVGVCLATSGPGATNLVTGIATANMDSVPLVAITGQVATSAIGGDSFQEADIVGSTLPLLKHSTQVHSPEQIPVAIKKAFYIASTGRPGPVLIDVPSDVQKKMGKFEYPVTVSLPGYHPGEDTDISRLDEAVELIENAQRPLIFAGGGVIRSKAAAKLTAFAKKLRIPVATSLMGKGAFPESNPLALGMAGMHGQPVANRALMAADVVIAVGSRFSDRTTGKVSRFAEDAKIIHIDLDPAEIDKMVSTDVWLVGDAGMVISALTKSITKRKFDRVSWLAAVEKMRKDEPLPRPDFSGAITPWQAIETLHDITGGKAVLSTEVGQHQMWAAQFFKVDEPNRFITSGGLGTMGFGFPAAIGACYAEPSIPSCCIAGDGSFMMNIQELDTCARYNIPVKVFIMNNSCLGMVRQWQDLFYDKRFSDTVYPRDPDFVKIAEGMGVRGFRATKPNEVKKTIEAALAVKGPAVVDFAIPQEANVFPMVPPGGAIDKMIFSRME